jgi:predicted transcriptional regulator
MGSRVGFWADDELDKRLDELISTMQHSPALRDLGITKGAVIKAALKRGLPFMELEHAKTPGGAIQKDELASWIGLTIQELLEWAEQLDLDVPRYRKK